MQRRFIVGGALAGAATVWLYRRYRRDLEPAREQVARVREGVLHGGLPYLAVGKGPALVVFPGLGAENASRMHLRPLQPMARHFTVYLVNRKPGLNPGSTLKDLADQYAEAIDDEFTGPVHVLGVSTGGSIALQLAIDHPQLVRRLVVLASACRLSAHGREVQRTLARLTVAGQPRRAEAAAGAALAATPAGSRLMAGLMWLLGTRMAPDDPSDLLTTIDAEDIFDASPELSRIAAPTLVIGGERDRFYTPELFRETAERIPRARLLLYPRKGHAGVMAHRPAVGEVLRFLTADDPPPSGEKAPG